MYAFPSSLLVKYFKRAILKIRYISLKYFTSKEEGNAYIPQVDKFPFIGYAQQEKEYLIGSSQESFIWYSLFRHTCEDNEGEIGTNGLSAEDVTKMINDALSNFASVTSNDGEVNTYKEMLDYIDAHTDEYEILVENVEQKADVTNVYTKTEFNQALDAIPTASGDDISALFN